MGMILNHVILINRVNPVSFEDLQKCLTGFQDLQDGHDSESCHPDKSCKSCLILIFQVWARCNTSWPGPRILCRRTSHRRQRRPSHPACAVCRHARRPD
jgi:hypothetical protein